MEKFRFETAWKELLILSFCLYSVPKFVLINLLTVLFLCIFSLYKNVVSLLLVDTNGVVILLSLRVN